VTATPAEPAAASAGTMATRRRLRAFARAATCGELRLNCGGLCKVLNNHVPESVYNIFLIHQKFHWFLCADSKRKSRRSLIGKHSAMTSQIHTPMNYLSIFKSLHAQLLKVFLNLFFLNIFSVIVCRGYLRLHLSCLADVPSEAKFQIRCLDTGKRTLLTDQMKKS
jgi:hypothetical protein